MIKSPKRWRDPPPFPYCPKHGILSRSFDLIHGSPRGWLVCRSCSAEYQRDYRRRHPEVVRVYEERAYERRRYRPPTNSQAAANARRTANQVRWLEDHDHMDKPDCEEPLPLTFGGHSLGDGGFSHIVQSRCRYWIPGMFYLIKAIEDAKDLSPIQLHRAFPDEFPHPEKRRRSRSKLADDPWRREAVRRLLNH